MESQQFEIRKTYEGHTSKNQVVFTGTEIECKQHIRGLLNLSRRNGADIVQSNEESYTCEDYDGNGAAVKFEIIAS